MKKLLLLENGVGKAAVDEEFFPERGLFPSSSVVKTVFLHGRRTVKKL
jgi:hypothetical protein